MTEVIIIIYSTKQQLLIMVCPVDYHCLIGSKEMMADSAIIQIFEYWEFCLGVRTTDRCGAYYCKPVKPVEGVGRRGGGFLVTGESPMVMIS